MTSSERHELCGEVGHGAWRGGARASAAAMSRSAAGDDDDVGDVTLGLVDHVPPLPVSSGQPPTRVSLRLPPPPAGPPSPTRDPTAVGDSSFVGGRTPQSAASRRNSPSPSPRRLSFANASPTARSAAFSRASSRRKSVQPVSPEPELPRDATGSPLGRHAAGGDGEASHGVGYRLGRRKQLAERRKRLADYSLVFAMFGVVSMMVEMELTMAELYDKVRRDARYTVVTRPRFRAGLTALYRVDRPLPHFHRYSQCSLSLSLSLNSQFCTLCNVV